MKKAIPQLSNTKDLAMLVDHQSTSFFKHRPSILILAISIIVTGLTFAKMLELEHLRLQSEFDRTARNIVTTLRDSLENNLAVLDEFGGFYSASQKIDRTEFKDFTDYILKRRKDIYMFAWSPRTPIQEIESMRKETAAHGIPDFSVKQYDHRGLIFPAQERDEYYPVFYVEPFQINKNILGLDQASYSVTQVAIKKSIQTGRPASTIIMSLPQFEHEPPASRHGFQVFSPIYKNHSSTDTIEERKQNLAGFIVVAFHVRRMLESVMKNLTTTDLEIRIFARGIRAKEKLIYTYNAQSAEAFKERWKFTSEINVAGQPWTVVCTSSDVFKKNHYRWEAPAVFGVGILLGFLLAFYIFSFERNRIREIMIALSLTDELTDLYNRRGFWLLADEQMRIALRYKRGFWLLVMDLDHLKKVNDTLGHPEGDRVLVRAANLFRETFRKSDIISRIGGDEFAVIALETTSVALPSLLDHVQSQLQKNNALKENAYDLSISTGGAYFDPENPSSFEDLMAAADKELYAHKKSHRDQKDLNSNSSSQN